MDQYETRHSQNVKKLDETYKKGIVQRIARNLLDIQILRLVQTQPMWGYMIKKHVEAKFDVRLRHGALYPLLNSLEKQSFLTCEIHSKGGRVRKVYSITQKGKHYLGAYDLVLQQQLSREDIE